MYTSKFLRTHQKIIYFAKKIIIKAGLTLGSISFEVRDDLLPETVITQSLDANLEVMQGDTINLLVSKLPVQLKDKLE